MWSAPARRWLAPLRSSSVVEDPVLSEDVAPAAAAAPTGVPIAIDADQRRHTDEHSPVPRAWPSALPGVALENGCHLTVQGVGSFGRLRHARNNRERVDAGHGVASRLARGRAPTPQPRGPPSRAARTEHPGQGEQGQDQAHEDEGSTRPHGDGLRRRLEHLFIDPERQVVLIAVERVPVVVRTSAGREQHLGRLASG